MGGKTSTSSSSGGNSNNSNNNNQANQIAKEVKKNIGLTAVGGLGGQNQGYIAANAPNPLMYGGAASTEAKKAMDKAGLGTYNKDNDSFQNVVGNKIISSTGIMGTSMGSGENTIMGQIPISEKMFQSQKRLQMIATGAMSALGVPLMGAAFMDYNRKKYSDYVTSFNNTLQSSTSYATKTNESKSDNKEINTSSNVTVNDSGVDGGPSEAARLKKLALTKQTAAVNAERKLFNTTKQTITGAMV